MTSVGENIKKTRNKIGITQEELAEKINVTRQAVSNWENGKTEPILKLLQKLLKFLISALMNWWTEFQKI